jgi:plastin-1
LSINRTLASISKDGKGVSDLEMVKWANDTVKKGGKASTMRSFKDASLSTGIFFLDLLNGLKPGYVDYNLVTRGQDAEEKKQNGPLLLPHFITPCALSQLDVCSFPHVQPSLQFLSRGR